jgi:hypothetical protein
MVVVVVDGSATYSGRPSYGFYLTEAFAKSVASNDIIYYYACATWTMNAAMMIRIDVSATKHTGT